MFLDAPRVTSNIPPPLPAKPKQSVYAQIIGDTSGTYVQPQLILPPNYRRQSPTQASSAIKTYGNIDTAGASKIQYSNVRPSVVNHSISSEHQKHPSYLAKLVCFINNLSEMMKYLRKTKSVFLAKPRAASSIPRQN